MKACNLCWRILTKETQGKSIAGLKVKYCKTCLGILGHDFDRHASMSDEEAEKWFEGNKQRKLKNKTD